MSKGNSPDPHADRREGFARSPAIARIAWSALTDWSGCAVLVRDAEGRYYFANGIALHTLGITWSVLKSKGTADLFSPEATREFRDQVERVLKTGKPLEVVEMIRGKRMRTVYLPMEPVEGCPPLVLVVARSSALIEVRLDGVEVVLAKHGDHGRLGVLSERELEVLQLVGEGLTTRQIATKLSRTVKTVEAHRASLGRKLGVDNRVQLARIAIDAGLVSPGH